MCICPHRVFTSLVVQISCWLVVLVLSSARTVLDLLLGRVLENLDTAGLVLASHWVFEPPVFGLFGVYAQHVLRLLFQILRVMIDHEHADRLHRHNEDNHTVSAIHMQLCCSVWRGFGDGCLAPTRCGTHHKIRG